jgi:hypothetical protein
LLLSAFKTSVFQRFSVSASSLVPPFAPRAEPPFVQKLRSDAGTNFLLLPQVEMEARVGLEEVDFECKNSLILLVIHHFCEAILQDGFTIF